jgi:hypothetical protein
MQLTARLRHRFYVAQLVRQFVSSDTWLINPCTDRLTSWADEALNEHKFKQGRRTSDQTGTSQLTAKA